MGKVENKLHPFKTIKSYLDNEHKRFYEKQEKLCRKIDSVHCRKSLRLKKPIPSPATRFIPVLSQLTVYLRQELKSNKNKTESQMTKNHTKTDIKVDRA